jgi:carboxylesterase
MADRREAESDILNGAETIDLQEEGSRGVLLLHGFGDTPQTLTLLARRLHAAGYSVLAPLLPGHGRTMRAFSHSNADEWVAASRTALEDMQARYADVSVVGLSMGGALAAIITSASETVRALVLIAPYLEMPLPLRLAARTHWLWGCIAGEINARNPRSIRNPIEREKNLAYGLVTGRALSELWKVVRRARKVLPTVIVPTLIVQSRADPRIAPGVAERVLALLGARDKKLVWAEGGHIITVDYGRERVFAEVEAWLARHGNSIATAAGP